LFYYRKYKLENVKESTSGKRKRPQNQNKLAELGSKATSASVLDPFPTEKVSSLTYSSAVCPHCSY
jgi:hypothetical protein